MSLSLFLSLENKHASLGAELVGPDIRTGCNVGKWNSVTFVSARGLSVRSFPTFLASGGFRETVLVNGDRHVSSKARPVAIVAILTISEFDVSQCAWRLRLRSHDCARTLRELA